MWERRKLCKCRVFSPTAVWNLAKWIKFIRIFLYRFFWSIEAFGANVRGFICFICNSVDFLISMFFLWSCFPYSVVVPIFTLSIISRLNMLASTEGCLKSR